MWNRVIGVCLVAALLVPVASACSPSAKRAPVLVAQVGLGIAQSVGLISDTATQLQKASILPTATALRVQQTLLEINTTMKPLPDLLRAIDAAQQAGEAQDADIDKAIAILQVVGSELSVVLAGVPLGETTTALVDLVKASQVAVQTVLVEVARLREL